MTATNSSLISLDEALQLSYDQNIAHHQRHLNPRHVRLAQLVGIDKPITRACGSFFWDSDGTQYLDFLGGFAALNVGYNHPKVCTAIDRVKEMPNLVEGLNLLSGALAHNLASIAPGELERVYFANSGAEVIDAAIKLVRAATGRARLVSCHNGFHGRTVGALSLMDRREYHDPFTPLLADVAFVPFGDAKALEKVLRHRNVAAFFVEPIQGEGGIVVPPAGYLRKARELCSRYGTLMVCDEIQTGFGRTGTMFAVEYEDVTPDVLLVGKALGGGIMPLSGLLTTDELYQKCKGDTVRTPFHTSTYGANTRSCAVGLVTLEVLVEEHLVEKSAASGAYLLDRLRELKGRQPLIADVRGRGLMIGIEFAPATRGLATLMTAGVANHLSHQYLIAMVIQRLLSQHRIYTGLTLNNQNVLRMQPQLNVTREHLDYIVDCLDETLQHIGSFTRAALRSLPDLLRTLRA